HRSTASTGHGPPAIAAARTRPRGTTRIPSTTRLREALLDPLGPHGSRRYRRAVFDYRTDGSVHVEPEVAAVDAVLLFDGVFLLRPELAEAWDLRIFVVVRPEESLRRASTAVAAPSAPPARAGAASAPRSRPARRL